MDSMPKFVWFVFAIAIFLRIIFLLLTPLNQFPDERTIFQRVWAIKMGSLMFDPAASEHNSVYYPNNEYYYPPLYFYLAAFFIQINSFFKYIPEVFLHAYPASYLPLRFLSLILISIGLFLVWKILDKLNLKVWIKYSTFTLVSLIPSFVSFSTAINHNVLVFLLLSLVTYLLVRQKNILQSFKGVAILGLVVGLALLTKFDSVIILPFLILKIIASRNAKNFPKKVLTLITFILIGGGWWYLQNLIHFGFLYDSALLKACLQGFISPFQFSNYLGVVFLNGFRTFFGTFGVFNDVYFGNLAYIIFLIFILAAILGYLLQFRQIWKIIRRRQFLLSNYFGLFLGFLLNLLIFIQFNFFVAYQPQGRFLFPSLLFISLILILGISKLFPKKSLTIFPWILLFGMIFFNLWALRCVIAVLNSFNLPPEFLNCTMETYIGKY